MSYGKEDRLIQMVNKIATNLAAHGESQASLETAQHIVDYWAPAMRSAILAVERNRLSSIAGAAVERIRRRQIQEHRSDRR